MKNFDGLSSRTGRPPARVPRWGGLTKKIASPPAPAAAIKPRPAQPGIARKPGRPWRKGVAAALALALLLVGVFSFLILPEARIKIELRTEPTTRDLQIQVDQKQPAADPASLAIPGKVIEQDVSQSKTFTPTGSRNIGQTASGFVSIYNFSKTTLILKAQTTVLTANNHKYYFTQDVGNIRPTAFIGLSQQQEVDPTSLIPPVPVIAAAAGGEYNLPKGTRLEIENEAFGKQPDILYAVVAEDLAGGTTKNVKVVTQSDVAAAYDSLGKDLIASARQALANQNPNLKLLDNAYTTQLMDQKTSVQPGAQVEQFDASISLKLRALVYDDSDVQKVVVDRIARLLPSNQTLQTGGTSTRLQESLLSVNLDSGQAVLQTHFEGQIIYKLDQQDLVEKLKGRNAQEIKEILLSRPEVAAAEIKFYPFWVKSAPKFSNKIILDITQPSP